MSSHGEGTTRSSGSDLLSQSDRQGQKEQKNKCTNMYLFIWPKEAARQTQNE